MDDGTRKLFDECTKCGGAGRWTRPAERTGNSTGFYGSAPCPDCDGIGMILTGDGQHLRDFLRRLKRVGTI
jgi:DnaJ-class molecular chaperone